MFLLLPIKDSLNVRRPDRLPRLELRANYIKLEEDCKLVDSERQRKGEMLAKKLDLSNNADDDTVHDPQRRRNQEAVFQSVDWLIGEGSNHVARRRGRKKDDEMPGSRLTPCDGMNPQRPRRGGRRRHVRRISRTTPQSEPAHVAICNSTGKDPSDWMYGRSGNRSGNGLGQEPHDRVERSASVGIDDTVASTTST
jgi:hypothetical protein